MANPAWTPNPDSYIKDVPEFDGRREKLEPFIEAIDQIAPAIVALPREAAPYYLQKIKTKLTGKARLVLDLNTEVNNWTQIKTVLINNFGEKRNIFALTDELRNCRFNNDVLGYLNEIRYRLRNLVSKARSEAADLVVLNRDIEHYNRLALKVFINGLPETHSTILHARNPNTLEEAERILGETDHLYSRRSNRTYNNNFQVTHSNNNNAQRVRHDQNPNNARNNNFNGRQLHNFNNFQQNNNRNFGNPNRHPNNNNNRNFNNNVRPNFNQNRGTNRMFGERSQQTRQQIQPRPEPMDTSMNTIDTNRDSQLMASEEIETMEYPMS